MELNVLSNNGEVVRMQLKGEVVQTMLRAPDAMDQLLGNDAYSKRVILDMGGTVFLDSSGVGWLLLCNKRFRQAAGSLVIHSVPPLVMDMMKVMRLDRVFRIADDERSAIEQLAGGAV